MAWPTDDELAAKLGLLPGDDTGNVASANAAAQADMVNLAGIDVAAGPVDASQFEATLGLAMWWYQDRNRLDGIDTMNVTASPMRRRMFIQIASQGRPVVA